MTKDAVPCSLCRSPLLGRAVGMFDHFETGVDWNEGHFEVYEAHGPSGEKQFVLLHEKCFDELIHELAKQELSAMIVVALGTIEDIRAGMEM